jgi:hypothetical protein
VILQVVEGGEEWIGCVGVLVNAFITGFDDVAERSSYT